MPFSMGDGLAPKAEGGSAGRDAEDSDEVVFPELDGLLGDVALHHGSKPYPGGLEKTNFTVLNLKFRKKHIVFPSSVTTEFVDITTHYKTKFK